MLLDSLQFSLNATLPTMLIMLLGVYLRRYRWIDEHFCQTASKVIFNFALPVMLFLNVAQTPSDYAGQIRLILSGVIGTLLVYVAVEWWAGKYIQTRAYRAIFTQGSFRSNAAILGLALAVNAYGAELVGTASIFIAVLVILFNVLGVFTLMKSLSDKQPSPLNLLLSMLKNPLIMGVVVGMVVNEANLFHYLPVAFVKTGTYLSHITLPLALICTGANLNFKQLAKFRSNVTAESEASRVVLLATVLRLVIVPVFMLLIGKFVFALDPVALGILFLTTSGPVASAVYAMVRNYGGDATVTAKLIGLTTIGSIFTASLGLFLLRQIGWV